MLTDAQQQIFNTDNYGCLRINTENEAVLRTNPYKSVTVRNINAYLADAPDVFIESRNKPLCDVPEIVADLMKRHLELTK